MAEFALHDSDDSDLELLTQLSDWDTDTDSEVEVRQRAVPKRIKRVNYMQSLDDAEFTFRFRLSKSAVNSLLAQLMPFESWRFTVPSVVVNITVLCLRDHVNVCG